MIGRRSVTLEINCTFKLRDFIETYMYGGAEEKPLFILVYDTCTCTYLFALVRLVSVI